MLSIKSLVEELGVFERNKVPLELKVLGLAFYIQLSSLRRAAGALSKILGFLRQLFGSRLGNLVRGLMLSLPGCLGGL
jgi:hypothetical protein